MTYRNRKLNLQIRVSLRIFIRFEIITSKRKLIYKYLESQTILTIERRPLLGALSNKSTVLTHTVMYFDGLI